LVPVGTEKRAFPDNRPKNTPKLRTTLLQKSSRKQEPNPFSDRHELGAALGRPDTACAVAFDVAVM